MFFLSPLSYNMVPEFSIVAEIISSASLALLVFGVFQYISSKLPTLVRRKGEDVDASSYISTSEQTSEMQCL